MTDYTVTVVDTSGIQNYIFGSNKLKHIIGASELVYRATHHWVWEALVDSGTTNVDEEGCYTTQTIDGDNLTSELIYAGGGNAVILFQDKEATKQFTRFLTRKALVEAPGLSLVIAHNQCEWQPDGQLKEAVDKTFELLAIKKSHRQYSNPLRGLGVTADCQYRGTPAIDIEIDPDDNERLVSAEIIAKNNMVKLAKDRLAECWSSNFESPLDFDDFSRTKGESSYLAVVHIDGNKMGNRITRLSKNHASSNRAYINAMRDFSEQVHEKSVQTLRETIQHLHQAVDQETLTIGGVIELDPQERFLPFRPLIFGGDDLTFVCDGRLGLSLTAYYMERFYQHTFSPDDTPITTRAGVAVVKTHYPFGRAYQLAEALAKNAKNYSDVIDDYADLCLLDWHFAVGGLITTLKQIREQEYTVPAGNLTMRPIRVIGNGFGGTDTAWRSWDVLKSVIHDFQNNPKEEWKERRNKTKALREALRDGEKAVETFLTNYDCELPDTGNDDLNKTGWSFDRCGYFDAIEAMDFFIPLEEATS